MDELVAERSRSCVLVRIAPLTSRAYGNFDPMAGRRGNVALVRQAQILVKIARVPLSSFLNGTSNCYSRILWITIVA